MIIMSMRSRNPFDEIEQFFERMSRQFEESEWPMAMGADISVDVAEHDDEFVVTADLPGYEKEHIDLKLSDSTLRISAEKEAMTDEEKELEEGYYIRKERRHESISRSVKLPEEVDEEGVKASLKHGVLTITLPKLAVSEAESRKIDIE